MNNLKIITVIGAGAWGTALANVLGLKGHTVKMWSIESDVNKEINTKHQNNKYFPKINVTLSKNITAYDDLKESLQDSDYILIAVPSHIISKVIGSVINLINKKVIIINVAKGLINEHLPLEYFEKIINQISGSDKIKGVVSLLGGTLAVDVVQKQPAIVTVTGKNYQLATEIANFFNSTILKAYPSHDYIGCEFLNLFKNILAILTGFIDGYGYGINSQARIITEVLQKLKPIIKKFKGDPETIFMPSSLGDYIVTCLSNKSRNYSFGYQLAKDNDVKITLDKFKNITVEGYSNIFELKKILVKKNLNIFFLDPLIELLQEKINCEELLKKIFY
ncbi:NAD(P)H-dependent glycerol-3-phosphate dehydrogenase [Mycoplasma sp. SG1]|uniref:NAD(P)H-dependent glycerol-3-phosphate dehydrogenase n=1 Tax=Mycoplasma sp. SG1 TaxID=2810348 RepID=UPI0020251220|nr:NAD(P)H-dependent glycerol-3-phosphate dehydrogenase [Mycoplasma sp. SG1]URM53134.1 NAD(P)-binding domain-containing protein [Mycoplasma sp. SG1]